MVDVCKCMGGLVRIVRFVWVMGMEKYLFEEVMVVVVINNDFFFRID